MGGKVTGAPVPAQRGGIRPDLVEQVGESVAFHPGPIGHELTLTPGGPGESTAPPIPWHILCWTPNGVGLSPNEDRLYYAETATGRVWFWELDAPGVARAAGPQISSTSAPATMLGNVGGIGRLDSLAVDSEGNVCVATLMTGCITTIAADGSIRAVVPVPGGDPMITNICFGGPDLT